MTTTFEGLPPPVKTASKPTVTYQVYVRDFARAAMWYVFVAVAGLTLTAGAVIRLTGTAQAVAIAGGLGMAIGGAVGFLTMTAAHNAYTRLLGMATTTTYAEPPATAPTVRPFVPSHNGAQTIRAGRFSLTRSQWLRLFQTAGDGGKLTRDNAMRALPRALYRDWQSTLTELMRLGIVDDNGVITDDGWRFYRANVSPYPDGDEHERAQTSTHARSTHDAHEVTA